jgi:hypothetical protein
VLESSLKSLANNLFPQFFVVVILVDKTNVDMKDLSDQKHEITSRQEQREPICILFEMHLVSCHGYGLLAF